MKISLLSRESIILLFELGIEILKSMKDIYESKSEERTGNVDNTTKSGSGNTEKDNNNSNRITDS